MIPVSLTIKGLYSYQNEQTIDFKPLMEGQIFGIFGPVGSGKSSILEAICFALYNETDRLMKKGDNRNYNMMNLKSDELLIDFIFQNFDGINYRFVVRGKRRGTDFLNVPKYSRSAYKKVGKKNKEEWLPLEITDAESILGLSYQNFRRTIIIPQGRFQEFLQLGDKARTEMLKALFHLDKYEFFHQTSRLHSKTNEEVTFLEGKLDRYAGIDKSLINIKKEELKNTNKSLKALKKTISGKEIAEKKLAVEKARVEELVKKKTELQLLEDTKDEIELLKQKVKDYEFCEKTFKSLIQQKNEALHIFQLKMAALKKEVDSFDELSDRIERVKERFKAINEKYHGIEDLKKEITDYDLLIKLAGRKSALLEIEKEQNTIKAEQKLINREIKTLESSLKSDKSTLKTLKGTKADTWDIAEIDKWFDLRKSLLGQVNMHEASFQKHKKALDQFRAGWFKELDNWIINELKDLVKGPQHRHLEQISALKSDISNQIAESAAELGKLQLHVSLENFKHELKPGEACPLCGSLEHPEMPEKKDISKEVQKAQNKYDDLVHQKTQLDKAEQITGQSISQEQLLVDSLQEAEGFLKIIESKMTIHNKAFKWPQVDPEKEDEFKTLKKELKKTEAEQHKLELSIENTEQELVAVKKNAAVYDQHNNKLETEKAAKASEIKTLVSQLNILSEKDADNETEALSKSKEKVLTEVEAIENSYKDTQAELIKLNEFQASAKGAIDQMKKELDDHESRLSTLKYSLEDAVRKSDFANVETVESILNQDIDIEKERERIKRFDQRLYKLKEDKKQLELLIKKGNYDPEEYQKLVKEIKQLNQQMQVLNDTVVGLKNKLSEMESDFRLKLELQKELSTLKNRLDDLATLRNLFRGGGFVNFISSVYLENLKEAANERFSKLTRQQLRLEITENNTFEVKDFLNNGKSRSVKTLSGGQTFQAALSLALALADSVQEQNKAKQNFFFLDEGFGSLDKESLQTVFETLKQLRKENRVVGVISHVEDLQQEIDVFLSISNDPEKGSQIRKSWKY